MYLGIKMNIIENTSNQLIDIHLHKFTYQRHGPCVLVTEKSIIVLGLILHIILQKNNLEMTTDFNSFSLYLQYYFMKLQYIRMQTQSLHSLDLTEVVCLLQAGYRG